MIDINIPPHKDKFHRRCCFNCRHHLDFRFNGEQGETVCCSLRARKEYTNYSGETYIGVDYSQRIAAAHPPCDDWEINTNVPKGFKWDFLDNQPKQLTIDFNY